MLKNSVEIGAGALTVRRRKGKLGRYAIAGGRMREEDLVGGMKKK